MADHSRKLCRSHIKVFYAKIHKQGGLQANTECTRTHTYTLTVQKHTPVLTHILNMCAEGMLNERLVSDGPLPLEWIALWILESMWVCVNSMSVNTKPNSNFTFTVSLLTNILGRW